MLVCLAPLLVSAVASTGCATLRRPQGDWDEPLNLNIPTNVFAGDTIAVTCAGSSGDDPAHVKAGVFQGCRDLVHMIKDMGADVQADASIMAQPTGNDAAAKDAAEDDAKEQKDADAAALLPPLMRVRYIDRGGERDFCGWTLPIFILTFSFFPCVEDQSVAAEIDIADADGELLSQVPLKMDVVRIYGPVALYYRLVHGVMARGHHRDEALKTQLAQYVVEHLVTSRERLKSIAQSRASL